MLLPGRNLLLLLARCPLVHLLGVTGHAATSVQALTPAVMMHRHHLTTDHAVESYHDLMLHEAETPHCHNETPH